MVIQLLLVAGFVLVHLIASTLKFLDVLPRSRWLSFAGGISVTYVFMHLFPEIREAQQHISEGLDIAVLAKRHAYFIALLGLVLFYGLERHVQATQSERKTEPSNEGGETTTGIAVFWLHIGSFAFYNALIGYLLVHRESDGMREKVFFFIAMALHFLVNDYGLRQDHKDTYKNIGRWVLSGAIVLGWLIALFVNLSPTIIHSLFSFLAGGVILNVLKEELPEERQSQFLPFLCGVVGYATLLLFF